MAGWILISRDIVNHWIWGDDKRFKWWCDLLIMAAWEDHEVMHDSHKFILRRGQLIASVAFLNKKWGGDPKTTLRFLKFLEKEGMIEREVCHRQTPIITICNYDKYQGVYVNGLDRQTDTLRETQTDRQTDRQTDTLKETNKRNKRNKRNIISPNGENTCAPVRVDVSPQDVVDAWNEICISLPKVKVLHDKRKEKIKARLKEMGTLEKAREVFTKIQSSDFCTSGKRWMSFDWVMENPSNWVKVDEGNYDNPQQQVKQNGTDDPKRSGAVAQSSSDFKLSF